MFLDDLETRDLPAKLSAVKASCQNCRLRDLCLPIGLAQAEIDQLDGLVSRRQRVRRSQHVFRAGTPFHFLYAIRSGFFKSYDVANDGREQINGFYVGGEILGLDAIASDVHGCSAVALEDGEVCEIPFDALERLAREIPALQGQLHRILSREISSDHRLARLLGTMSAERKLAVFLVNLSARFRLLGYSPTSLLLRMSREEIGNYLGLTIETVSRTFTKLQNRGLIDVQRRHIVIRDLDSLQQMVDLAQCGH